MNMKQYFNMSLLAVGLMMPQMSFGQDSKPAAATTMSTSLSQTMPPVVFQMTNGGLTDFETYKEMALSYTYKDGTGKEQKLFVFAPSAEKSKEFGAGFNAIIAPVAFVNFENKNAYGRSEYAAFVIDKAQRKMLTKELLDDPEMLKQFLETKGNVTEIDRNISQMDLNGLLEKNKTKNPVKSGAAVLAIIGG